MKIVNLFLTALMMLSFSIAPFQTASAAYGLDETAKSAGLISTGPDLPTRIGSAINIALGMVGLVFLILAVYGGFRIMLSQGNPESVKTGRNTLLYAVIGMIVIASAYAVTSFVITRIAK